MSYLQQEIYAQPAVLQALLDRQPEFQTLAAHLQSLQPTHLLIAARGTSDNAARYAQYLFSAFNRLPVALATPSLFSVYGAPPRLAGALVIGISQSGRSPDIVAVVEEARRQGQPTIAITNEPASPLAQAADHAVALEAGAEQSVAATKTYTAELLALALLSTCWAGDTERLQALQRLPEAVAQTLQLEPTIAQLAPRYTYATEAVVVGRGFNYATAFEIALKIKELTYVVAEPYSSADFRHGPVAIVERGFPVVAVAPGGLVFDDLLKLLRELAEREAELIVISDQAEALALAHTPLPLPVSLPEWLSPFTCIVPGQLLALHITQAKGYEPDHPRGLKKVTRTL
jgi:glucosamine--fructose-6-phosphate aminotransferase (isomerizing)